MPGIDGEQTLKALKKEHEWMEIIILTGHGSIDSALECSRRGAYEYLQKPCNTEELLEVLKEAYKKKVMNRNKIEEKRINEMLKMAGSASSLDILNRLREIDSGRD
jgi:DNA-binding NtrC family response regulator